ncbi:hypothetical protein DFS34DRAFT_690781 [Phlyctochytrium arcticum]|nr:hypothetical protein DFS34DRAFT_690781 [Phlyctochytrium arcticum]
MEKLATWHGTHLTLESHSDVYLKAQQPFTDKSDVTRTLRVIFEKKLATKWTDVPVTLKTLTKHYNSKLSSTQGKYIGRLATFLKKAGHTDLGVTPARLIKIVAGYNAKANDLEQSYLTAREAGQASEREAGRDINVPWPELQTAAEDYWASLKEQFYSANINRKLYDQLLTVTILMLCVRYYNIRSAWVTVKRAFHSTTENGYIWATGACWLIFNRRKNNSTQIIQQLPEPVIDVLRLWSRINKADELGHLLCNFEGQPLSQKAFTERVTDVWNRLLDKPVGISDMRRSQITWMERNITDPLERRSIPVPMHHSQHEHSLYFREALVEDDQLDEDTGEETGETEDASHTQDVTE